MATITTAPGQTFDFRLLSPFQFNATYEPGTTFELFSFHSGNQISLGFRTYIDDYIDPNAGGYNPGFDTLLQTAFYNGTLTGPVFDEPTTDIDNVTFTGNWTISDGSGATVATVVGAEVSGQLVTYASLNDFNQLVHDYTFANSSVWDLFDDLSDTVTLGDGDDHYFDPTGSLWIDLGGGDDWLFAAGSNDGEFSYADTIFGGSGNDLIEYQNHGHYIDGGEGNDTIRSQGNGGNPGSGGTFIGGTGDDMIEAYGGETIIEGAGSGNDIYTVGVNAILDYSTAGALTVDLSDAATQRITETATGDQDSLSGFDFTVLGSQEGDTFLSYTPTNFPYAYTLNGQGGDDAFHLIWGGEAIDGGAGNDLVSFQLTSDQVTIVTNAGVTTVTYVDYWGTVITSTVENAEVLRFQNADISLLPRTNVTLSGAANTWVPPVPGNYSVSAGGGNDTVTAGDGNDVILGGTGNDSLAGGGGHDTFRYGNNSGTDRVFGGAGIDRILAEVANATLTFAVIDGIESIEAQVGSTAQIKGTANADSFDLSGVVLSGISQIDMGKGNDAVTGTDATDYIIGGAGNDTLYGGAANDVFYIGSGAGTDVIDGGADQGGDVIVVTAENVVLPVLGITGVEFIQGTGTTRLTGSGAADTLDLSGVGLSGIALIDGGGGADTITGSAAGDRIQGGDGADVLAGGLGADSFVFTNTNQSKGTNADRIIDFAQGEDVLDLSAVDGNRVLTGVQDFVFIGAAAFSGVAGQLRYDATSVAGETRVIADTNGDLKTDMVFRLTGTFALAEGDFLL